MSARMDLVSQRYQSRLPEQEIINKKLPQKILREFWLLYIWKLFDFDDGASFFEFLLGVHGGILANSGEDLAISGLG